MPGVKPYDNEDALIKKIKEDLAAGEKKTGRTPRALVIGMLKQEYLAGSTSLTHFQVHSDAVDVVQLNYLKRSASLLRTS